MCKILRERISCVIQWFLIDTIEAHKQINHFTHTNEIKCGNCTQSNSFTTAQQQQRPQKTTSSHTYKYTDGLRSSQPFLQIAIYMNTVCSFEWFFYLFFVYFGSLVFIFTSSLQPSIFFLLRCSNFLSINDAEGRTHPKRKEEKNGTAPNTLKCKFFYLPVNPNRRIFLLCTKFCIITILFIVWIIAFFQQSNDIFVTFFVAIQNKLEISKKRQTNPKSTICTHTASERIYFVCTFVFVCVLCVAVNRFLQLINRTRTLA